jgi:hypothetical protein
MIVEAELEGAAEEGRDIVVRIRGDWQAGWRRADAAAAAEDIVVSRGFVLFIIYLLLGGYLSTC